jgi:peroxiredoxin
MIKQMLLRRMAAGIVLLCTCQKGLAQQEFTIVAELGKEQKGVVRLTYANRDQKIQDSVQFEGGRFTLRGKVSTPVSATIVINPLHGRIDYQQYISMDQREFYLLPGNNIIRSQTGLKAATIISGKEQVAFEFLDSLHKQFDAQTAALMQSEQLHFQAKNEQALQLVKDSLSDLRKKNALEDSLFIARYPDCFVAFGLFSRLWLVRMMELPEAEQAFLRFSQPIRQSFHGQRFAARIAKAKKLQIGSIAPEIALMDTTGQMATLSSLRGKYVLLCFWHIFSGRTSMVMRALGSARERLDSNNFSIYAVAVAPDWNSWLQTMARYSPRWTNVVDMNGVTTQEGQSGTAKAYDLEMMRIPQCYLIAPDGRILASGLSFDEHLPATIESLIRKQQ